MLEVVDGFRDIVKSHRNDPAGFYLNAHDNVLDPRFVLYEYASTHNGECIGMISYMLEARTDTVISIGIFHFESVHNYIFGKDVITFIEYLMHTHRKVNFIVVKGSPQERSYDRVFRRRGGWKCGEKKAELQLGDGKFYDVSLYEYVNEGKK